MAHQLRPRYPERLTRVGEELSARLEQSGKPLITPYDLFLHLRDVYASGKVLYLRREVPQTEDLQRIRANLVEAGILASDPNYGHRAYRIPANPDGAVDRVCCAADPFCAVSHLSAMERYGLTDRRGARLQLSQPAAALARDLIAHRMRQDYGPDLERLSPEAIYPLTLISHPPVVRRRSVQVFRSRRVKAMTDVRDTGARLTSIGQTFIDTLQETELCGGMPHVLDVWRRHARTWAEEIIAAVDQTPDDIVKVRAGYIFDEVLRHDDPRVQRWTDLAQRGGSRKLDPAKPYAPTYSEKWMISINA